MQCLIVVRPTGIGNIAPHSNTKGAFMATQRWRLFLGCALIIGSIFSSSASAQSPAAKQSVSAADLGVDARIADCSAVIERGKPATPRVIKAHFARAGAYLSKGDVDHAIDDYKIVIDQSSAGLLAAFDRAAPDLRESEPPAAGFGRAFGRNGYRAQAYRALGIASFQAGLLEQSQDGFRRLSEIDPKNADAALWLDLARRRAGLPSELADSAKRLDMGKWPAPIVRLFLGETTPEAVLAAADRGGPDMRRTRRCEASFFAGELMLDQGREADAFRLIDRALAECPQTSGERSVANEEARVLSLMP
jgi:tetratricopeptide (TPR) repeat protein